MADYTQGIDTSRWQGAIDWNAVKAFGVEIAIVKVSGSDAGDYVDAMASISYNAARAAGLAVGTYHFAGGTDPLHEAEYFVSVCSPLDENQVLVLDWEVQHSDPVGWCNTFVNRVHDLTGLWCVVYMNGSTRNAYNWDAVAANCGMWIAWYGRSPETALPVAGNYIAHQYASDGAVSGINGNVDMDAWFIDVATFNKYGYHASVETPPPAPDPTPAPVETPPAPDPTPVPPAPETPPTPDPTPVVIPPVWVDTTPHTPATPAGTIKAIIAGVIAAVIALIAWAYS